MSAPLSPVPGPQSTDKNGRLTPLWQSWFAQLYAYLTKSVVKVSGLPAAGTAGIGARYLVTDATVTTFASIVAGTGANIVPVYSDGTNWRIG